jgi:hypothetical protein
MLRKAPKWFGYAYRILLPLKACFSGLMELSNRSPKA